MRLFTWDEAKEESKRRKHGFGFEIAKLVFDDPLHLSRQDRLEGGEARWQTLGKVGDIVVLLVAHTWREAEGDEHIRIISRDARRGTKQERKIYEESP